MPSLFAISSFTFILHCTQCTSNDNLRLRRSKEYKEYYANYD
jgi:hypothetical protein